MRKLLIRMPNWLGDCVMATAFIKPLKKHFGEIYAAVPRGLERVFVGNKDIDQVISYDRKNLYSTMAAAKKISVLKPDCAASLTPSLSSHLLLLMCGAKERFGYEDDAGSILLTKAYKRDKTHRREHVAGEYEKIFTLAAGVPVKRGAQFLNSSAGVDVKKLSGKLKLFGKLKKIFVAPFAKGGPAKTWPAERYEEIVEKLLKKGAAVYLTGLESDKRYVFDKQTSAHKNFFDMRGAPLSDVFYALSKMNVFLGNDSGLMHAADALGVPLAVIFGATAPGWGGPLQSKAALFYKGIECQPCYEKECGYGHYRCLKEVSVEEVLKRLKF